MSDQSTDVNKIMTKKTEDLNAASDKKTAKKVKSKKTVAGSYNPKARKGYEKMLKEADQY